MNLDDATQVNASIHQRSLNDLDPSIFFLFVHYLQRASPITPTTLGLATSHCMEQILKHTRSPWGGGKTKRRVVAKSK